MHARLAVLSRYARGALCSFAVLAILGWVSTAAYHHWWRASLLTALAGAAFVLGTLVGFIFSTYDDEASTIGKVKDWLLGALATITLVKFAALKSFLITFAVFYNSREYALTVGVAMVFLVIGFFFMYFGRELLFNVPLARKRAERSSIETHQASMVTLQLIAAIPSSLLCGIDDAESLLKTRPALAAQLRESLKSKDVETFLAQSDAAIRTGQPIDWDIVSKNAYLEYYRIYFCAADGKQDQAATALVWIVRALVINPEHVDLTVKRADVLAIQTLYDECCATLARLQPQPECPAFIDQWLGYYLLFVRGREDDAIEASASYLARFKESKEARRNLACAYAQKYCREHCHAETVSGGHLDHQAPAYKAAMEQLTLVVRNQPEYVATIRHKWIAPRESFACFAQDGAFRALVGLPAHEPGDATVKSAGTRDPG